MIRVQVAAGTHIHRGIGRPATVADKGIEVYITDRWYNVWHYPEPDSNRWLWYSNIAMPATLDGTSLKWIGLDIDVCCHLDGSIQTLDYEEFQENCHKIDYSSYVVEQALATHDEVTELGEAGTFPFDHATQVGHWLDTQ